MGRFYYLTVGFFAAVCLIFFFFLLKNQWEEHKEQMERKMRNIAIEEIRRERKYTEALVGLKEYCFRGSKLAEKEGEHETD